MNNEIYISFTSWEDRFFKAYEQDIKENEFNKIILLNYKNGHHNEVKNKKIGKTNISKTINLNINNNKENWKIIKETIENIKENSVLINISTMPRNIVFFLLHFLNAHGVDIKTIYYNAEKHGPYLTENPKLPELALQHSGIFETKKKTILVVLLGYDEKRLYQLYNHFEPEKIIILFEKNHQTQIDKELDFDFNIIKNEKYPIDSFIENNILDLLEDKVTPLQKTHNIILCSLGPKLSSIEVFKYSNKYPNIALCYVSSEIYSEDYSTGVKLNEKYIRKI